MCDWRLWTIVMLALALRLLAIAGLDMRAPYTAAGGDSAWYLANGWALTTGRQPPGMTTDVSRLSSPPLFFSLVGVPQAIAGAPPPAYFYGAPGGWQSVSEAFGLRFGSPGAIAAIRILHAIIGAATCAFAYRLAWRISGSRRGALLTGLALALHPALIAETGQILTETLYIGLVMAGVWAFVEGMPPTSGPSPSGRGEKESASADLLVKGAKARVPVLLPLAFREREAGGEGWLVAAGVLLGAAALTRAIVLAYPVLLIALGWILQRKDAKTQRRSGWIFALAFALTVGAWTAYSVARWDRWVIAGEGLPAFLYIGATGWDDPRDVDVRLATALAPDNPNVQAAQVTPEPAVTQSDYLTAAGGAIAGDPVGYVGRRLGEWLGAILQPHGTALYPGESLRARVSAWARDDRSIDGLIAIARGEWFPHKLLMYVWHYAGIVLVVVGVWRLTRRPYVAAVGEGSGVRGRRWWPIVLFIAYTLGAHLFLLATPRYLFPAMVFAWVLASGALVQRQR